MTSDFIPRKVYRTFDGRKQEIQVAIEFLQEEGPLASRVLLVHGPRGIGKTALVWHISHWVKSNYGVACKYEKLLWIDRSNFDIFLDAFDELDKDLGENERIANNDLEKTENIFSVSRAFASKTTSMKMFAESKKKTIRHLIRNGPCLIIVDDFDEQNPLTAIQDVCEKLEKISEYPNKVIVTARSSYVHEFDDLALRKLAIGLLTKDELTENIKNSLKNYPEDLNKIVDFLWKKTGGLAELTNRFMIPIIENGQYLLSDKRLDFHFEKFVESYIFEMEQPKKLSNYKIYDEKKDAKLNELIDNLSSFSRLVLWNWVNLDDPLINCGLSEDELGTHLGYVVENEDVKSNFHVALQELYDKRLLSQRFERSFRSVKGSSQKEWVMVPVVLVYLKKYWHVSYEILKVEADHLINSLLWYSEHEVGEEKDVIERNLNRCCFLTHWFYDNQHHEVLEKLLEVIFEFLIKRYGKYNIKECNLANLLEIQIDILNKKETYSQDVSKEKWALSGRLLYILGDYEKAKFCIEKAICEIESTCEAVNSISTKSSIAVIEGSLEDAAELLRSVRQECVNALWVEACFQLATQYTKRQNYHASMYWYSSIIQLLSFHSEILYSLKACYQLARLIPVFSKEEIGEVIEVLKIGSSLARIKSNQEMYPEISACALCWYAACLEAYGDKDNARIILEYARSEIIKPYIPSSPLGLFVEERLIFMSQSNISSLINGLLDIPIEGDTPYALEYSYTDTLKVKCLICKTYIEKDDLKNIIECKECQVLYHKICFVELGSVSCVNCNSLIGVDYVS